MASGSHPASKATGLTGRFDARIENRDSVAGHDDLARLILSGTAAKAARDDIDRQRAILDSAIEAMHLQDVQAKILVTPAGYVNLKLNGNWKKSKGWDTDPDDYRELEAAAVAAVNELVSDDLLWQAKPRIQHLIVGVDVSPARKSEPHAEVACHVDVRSGDIRAVTGKTYPTGSQQRQLVRNENPASHMIRIGDDEVAVLVCHDLAAWSPRGNAVAKGIRADTFHQMQDAVTSGRPDLAVHLVHTAASPRTWMSAWNRFSERSGGRLRSGTSSIRHLTNSWGSIDLPPSRKLLRANGTGRPAIDIVVSERPD